MRNFYCSTYVPFFVIGAIQVHDDDDDDDDDDIQRVGYLR